MQSIDRAKYDRNRDWNSQPFHSACYAPFTSLYFDPLGNITPCCQTQRSEFALGNISKNTIDEAWNGELIRVLRRNLIDYRFPNACEFCRWQVEGDNLSGVFAKIFDDQPAGEESPQWPIMMEFALSNVCNFECIMCDGSSSSRIRERREKHPPLPRVYDDRFFSDLVQYLPHLESTQFFGGEPFLAEENFRIWDAMIDGEGTNSIPVRITTNGSLFNRRVERVLESLKVSIVVSLDSASKDTLETIRVGVRFESIMENVQHFRAIARRKGTDFSFAFCLMRQNCHEFIDFLLFAEDLYSSVFVNTISDPTHCSLYSLPLDDLKNIVDEMEKRGKESLSRLDINRRTCLDTIAALRNYTERNRASD